MAKDKSKIHIILKKSDIEPIYELLYEISTK